MLSILTAAGGNGFNILSRFLIRESDAEIDNRILFLRSLALIAIHLSEKAPENYQFHYINQGSILLVTLQQCNSRADVTGV